MKKLLVMVLMVVLASASTALATTKLSNYTTVPTGDTGDSDGVLGAAVNNTVGALSVGSTPFSVSTNVNLYADGNLGGYNVSSKHLSGDKSFVSSSVSASIKEASATKGVPMLSLILPTGTDLYTGTAGY